MSEESPGEDQPMVLDPEDQARVDAIVRFWFKEHQLWAPQIDGRLDVWWGRDAILDE